MEKQKFDLIEEDVMGFKTTGFMYGKKVRLVIVMNEKTLRNWREIADREIEGCKKRNEVAGVWHHGNLHALYIETSL